MVSKPLVVHGVVKRYGSRVILDGVDLDVGAGELVVLRGPNGTGKSTLIGCVTGQIVPDQGTVAIAGHDLRTAPLDARRQLRALAQEVEIPPGITGREWLAFCADAYGASAPASVGDPQLDEVIDHLATTYSVGLRRRLAFLGLCLGTPRLFVLDEPFAGVDQDGRRAMLDRLRRFLEGGAGILVAAHDHELGELDTLKPKMIDVRALSASSTQ
jgi:ABC-type multidrug transport system ATPase subunit